MIIYGPHVVAWVTEKLGVHPDAYGMHAQGIGVADKTSTIRAGVVYCSNNGYNLHAHIASDGSKRWLTKSFLRAMFSYPFETLGVPRITATTAAANIDAQLWLHRTGFIHEATLVNAASNGDDLEIYRMFVEECLWLNS